MLWQEDVAETYVPRAAPLFDPVRIVLAKGSNLSEPRRKLAEMICGACPRADVVEAFDVTHNRVDLGESDPLRLHVRGKQTLVLGEHCSSVRFSEEQGNTCPNYWHFSPYGFCPYGCHYCYLAGTPGVWFSPTVKIFLNLPEILDEIDRRATRIGRPTAFYLGKLQDALALDPLTGYSRQIVHFFADHPYARGIFLTKSDEVRNLLDVEHRGHTTLSWTVNAPEIVRRFEKNTPDVANRMDAMRRCADAGYPVRAVVMPIVPVGNWQEPYTHFLDVLLDRVPLSRITLGSICSYPQALRLMEAKLGPDNAISGLLDRRSGGSADGRIRFSRATREPAYRLLVETVRRRRPDLEIALCLEEKAMFDALDLGESMGRCNCVA